MSRSVRAWARGCELVGAAVSSARGLSGRKVVRDHLSLRPLVRTAPSFATLTWAGTSVVLMLAFAPALASGKSVNRSGRVPATRTAQGASQIAVAPKKQKSDPSQSGDRSGRRERTRVELLAFGSGYASAHGSGAVRALQRRLAGLGYTPGPIDGRYGPLTDQAVRRFQATHGLIVDGIDGPMTRKALASAHVVIRPGDGFASGGSDPVRGLQRHLAAAGFSPGPIDGRYGPLTERAVRRLQAARHLQVDGVAGPQTLGQFRGAAQRQVHRPSPHGGTHHRSAPSRTRTQTRPPRTRPTAPLPPRTLPHKTRPSAGHPGGTSLTPWLIVLACLMLPALLVLLRRGYRGRDRRLRAPPADADADSEPPFEPVPWPVRGPVSKPIQEPATGPEEDLAESDLPEDPRAAAGVFRLAQALAQAGKADPAVNALRRADRLGDPGAAFEMGLLLAQDGDLAGARDALLRADQRGHPEAAFELGALLEKHGDAANAQQAYRLGDARGHAGAAFNLGVLLLRGGDVAGAEDAFRRADERGHPGAASNLGVLLEERGDFAGGRAAYVRADDRGEAVGAYNLGLLLEQEGDLERAKAAFQRAVERGEPAAALRLGGLLEQVGDREGARRAFQHAGQLGPPEVAEFAHAALRDLHTDPEESDR